MPISDQELLEFSESIIARGASETELRAAISRGYYAAFHQAKAVADHAGLPQAPATSRGSHERVIHRFNNLFLGNKKVAALLHKKKMLRVKADYQLGEEITLEESRQHVASCRKLSKFLSMLSLVSPINKS